MSEQKIREELQKVLKDDPENFSKILELSNELAQYDKKKVRFSVDAGLIDRLGKELVAKHETAVSELVKNSYDADATLVTLSFINTELKGGVLEIRDNGLGMTRDQLINGFMRLSSSEKLHYPRSPRYDRKRAGRKGIGRFSAQRLGAALTIITQTKESEKALKLSINWDDFIGDKNLLSITNEVSHFEKIQEEGTVLIIELLRDSWTDAQIKRVYRYASEIMQPFPLSKKIKVGKFTSDPGFKLKCESVSDGKRRAVANEKNMFFSHALAEIEARVDSEGYIFLSFKSPKLDYKEKNILLNPDEPLKKLRNVGLNSYYFIYNGSGANYLPKQVDTLIRQKAQKQGGIRLYRNGFRVLPYGEQDDDWLGLDASSRRRSMLFPHSNMHFFGFIETNNEYGEQFEELSSREGLLHNAAFDDLSEFGYKALTRAAALISSLRGRKTSAGQKEWKKEPEEVIDDAISEIKSLIEDGDDYRNDPINELEPQSKLLEIASRLESAQIEQKVRKKEYLKEQNLLRVLAALGITIGEFIHEIKQYQGALDADVRSLEATGSLTDSKVITQRVKNNLKSLSTYTSYFDEAISENVQRELKPIEIRSVVRALQSTVSEDVKRRGIDFLVPVFNGYGLFTCPMHQSEWASILFNLYTNSRKAIKRAKSNGKIKITGGKVYNQVYLEFSDNGDGIQLEKRDKVFDAFYTTSAPVGKISNHIQEMTGTGLGLKIVRDIVTAYGGKIFVKEPIKGYSTTIRIELPWEKEGYKFNV